MSLTWNLYDGGGTVARTERMAQRSRQIAHQRDAVVRDRRIALDQARSEATSVASRITLAQRVVDLATSTYDDSRAQYREGRLTLVQVGDSSVRLGEARYRLLSLLYQEPMAGAEGEAAGEVVHGDDFCAVCGVRRAAFSRVDHRWLPDITDRPGEVNGNPGFDWLS